MVTKFEVGKEYLFGSIKSPIYQCLHVKGDHAVLGYTHKSGAYEAYAISVRAEGYVPYEKPRVMYYNVYADSISSAHSSREKADDGASEFQERLGCIRVEFPIGRFDE